MQAINQQPIDCLARPCIALSFDDGPMPPTTDAVLDILEQEQVRATFFLIGKNIPGHEAEVQRMARDGFEIGNHTWSHMDMTTLTPQQIKDELVTTQLAIVNAGAPAPTLFRPPYGAVNPGVVADAGLQTALWNEDPRDWEATDPAVVAQTIVSQAQPGGIVDLHDTHQVTVDALRSAIQQLKARGFQFVTVTQLMHSRIRPTTTPFYGYNASYYHFPPVAPVTPAAPPAP
jgi:peptidoglycan/xylan/chitin deacetylase (PgdA/CDA1 family)